MDVLSVFSPRFRRYGRIVTDYDCTELLREMEKTPLPEDRVLYRPSVEALEALPIFRELRDREFGGLPIQIGFTNGHNQKLNGLEYHRSSEWNLACTDLILLLGSREDVDPETFRYDTARAEAFLVPAGTAIECYATTLHYAPCGVDGGGYRSVVVLPRGTNLPLEQRPAPVGEDKLLAAKNKWLIAHPDSDHDPETAFFGLYGENLTV